MDRQSSQRAENMCLSLLNGFCLRRDDEDVGLFRGEQRLVAFVAIRGDAPRGLVAGTLWPEVTDNRALGSLRTTLWRLHRAVPAVVGTGTVVLRLQQNIALDVDHLIDVVDKVVRGGDDQVGPLLELHGELLPGWYDEWVLFERTRLRQLWLHAVELAGMRRLAAHDHLTALRAGLEAIRADPLRESAHRLVALAHRAEGNHMEAIQQIENCRAILADSGILASTQLRQLAEALRMPETNSRRNNTHHTGAHSR